MKDQTATPDEANHRDAIEVIRPSRIRSPLVFASPHSGRHYPSDFLQMSRLDRHGLRQSEDSYVDLLFDCAPKFGAPLLRALFPRAFVDVNRHENELDPRMFSDALPRSADIRSSRVLAGLGVIPRIVADGHDIYGRKLKYGEARRRLALCYHPYHAALTALIREAQASFGCAVLLDCHSMPSAGGAPLTPGEDKIDFVLGDRFGSSCAPGLISLVEQSLRALGYTVARNAPYAGGHVAAAYGRPSQGVHVLQIEINRALYLNEKTLARTDGFERLRSDLRGLMTELARIRPAALQPAIAAE